MSKFRIWSVRRVMVSAVLPKLGAATVIVYEPGARLRKRYRPVAELVVEAETCVTVLTKVTLAPTTTAPVGSVTVPCTLELNWAQAGPAIKKTAVSSRIDHFANNLVCIRSPIRPVFPPRQDQQKFPTRVAVNVC